MVASPEGRGRYFQRRLQSSRANLGRGLRGSLGQPARAWQWYNRQLVMRPVFTKSATAAGLFGVADSIAQTKSPQPLSREEQVRRTGKMMLIGGLLVGPLNAYFYDWLHLNFDALWKRVFLEEVVKMPAVMYAVQNVSNVADGMGARASHEKVAANFPHCFKVALALWLPCGTAIQSAVPLPYRVLACNLVQVVWEAFSSKVNHEVDHDRLPAAGA